jgi:hypothetical protein
MRDSITEEQYRALADGVVEKAKTGAFSKADSTLWLELDRLSQELHQGAQSTLPDCIVNIPRRREMAAEAGAQTQRVVQGMLLNIEGMPDAEPVSSEAFREAFTRAYHLIDPNPANEVAARYREVIERSFNVLGLEKPREMPERSKEPRQP